MKDKIKKWSLRRINRIKIIFDKITDLIIATGLMTTMVSLVKGNFWVIFAFYIIMYFIGLMYEGADNRLKEWEEAKRKDDENERNYNNRNNNNNCN